MWAGPGDHPKTRRARHSPRPLLHLHPLHAVTRTDGRDFPYAFDDSSSDEEEDEEEEEGSPAAKEVDRSPPSSVGSIGSKGMEYAGFPDVLMSSSAGAAGVEAGVVDVDVRRRRRRRPRRRRSLRPWRC